MPVENTTIAYSAYISSASVNTVRETRENLEMKTTSGDISNKCYILQSLHAFQYYHFQSHGFEQWLSVRHL